MEFLPEIIEEYLENHTQPEPEVLAKLNRDTHENYTINAYDKPERLRFIGCCNF